MGNIFTELNGFMAGREARKASLRQQEQDRLNREALLENMRIAREQEARAAQEAAWKEQDRQRMNEPMADILARRTPAPGPSLPPVVMMAGNLPPAVTPTNAPLSLPDHVSAPGGMNADLAGQVTGQYTSPPVNIQYPRNVSPQVPGPVDTMSIPSAAAPTLPPAQFYPPISDAPDLSTWTPYEIARKQEYDALRSTIDITLPSGEVVTMPNTPANVKIAASIKPPKAPVELVPAIYYVYNPETKKMEPMPDIDETTGKVRMVPYKVHKDLQASYDKNLINAQNQGGSPMAQATIGEKVAGTGQKVASTAKTVKETGLLDPAQAERERRNRALEDIAMRGLDIAGRRVDKMGNGADGGLTETQQATITRNKIKAAKEQAATLGKRWVLKDSSGRVKGQKRFDPATAKSVYTGPAGTEAAALQKIKNLSALAARLDGQLPEGGIRSYDFTPDGVSAPVAAGKKNPAPAAKMPATVKTKLGKWWYDNKANGGYADLAKQMAGKFSASQIQAAMMENGIPERTAYTVAMAATKKGR